jgi:Dolichyl-phosphate-mannose-protein mannosyltransferase
VPLTIQKNLPARLAGLLCPLFLILICLAISLPRYRAGIDWSDEGFLAYGAVRVMEGQVPNRDFVSLQPPLSFYVAGGAFKVFGPSLATLRRLGLSIFVLMVLLIYALARSLVTPSLAFAAAFPAAILGLPYFNFTPFAVWQGITASLAAALLYLHAGLTNRRWLAFPAGMLAAISIFLRHDQGIYLAISILILAVALKFATNIVLARVLIFWFLGAAAVALALSILWWKQDALPEMFRQLIEFPLTTYRKTSSVPFPHFSSQLSLAQNAVIVLYLLPPLVAVTALVWLVQRFARHRFDSSSAVLMFLLAWTALFYCQVLTRADLNHLLITLPPFFLLSAYCWHIFLAALGQRNILRIWLSMSVAAPVCWLLWTISPVVLPDISNANELLALDRGGVRMEKGEWTTDFIRGVQNYVPVDRAILALPYQPMFYFLCERRNPTRWNYLWPGDQTVQDHADLVEQAKSDPPAVVFIANEKDMATYASEILDYIHHDYKQAADFGALAVYFPQKSTPQ